jgi:hypothetical protein
MRLSSVFTARALLRITCVCCLCASLLILDGCRRKRGSSSTDLFTFSPPPSNVWVGYFRFDEYGGGDIGEDSPTAVFVSHTLTIRQTTGDSLRANLSASGVRHLSDIDCRVEEIDDTLKLYFDRYGENHDSTLGTYRKDTLLLSLVRSNYTLSTTWAAYKPTHVSLAAHRQGSVFFMKDNEDAVPNVDIAPFAAFWSEYTQTLKAGDSVKIAYMTAFPLVGSNYVRPEGALTDIVSKTDFMMNYQVALFPALRKVLENKKASDFQSSTKTVADNIYLPNGLVPQGAQMYRVNISSSELAKFLSSNAAQQSTAQQETNAQGMKESAKDLAKEQADILKRKNKIAKELSAEYGWSVIVARLQGKYRICYMGIAPKATEPS